LLADKGVLEQLLVGEVLHHEFVRRRIDRPYQERVLEMLRP